MRRALALGALAAAAAAAGLFLAARGIHGDALRDGLTRAFREELGLDVALGGVSVGPGGIDVADAIFAPDRGPALRVADARLDVALAPLFFERRADVRAVAIDGPIALLAGDATATADARGRLERRADGAWSVSLAGAFERGGTFALEGEWEPRAAHLVLTLEGVDAAPLAALARREDELEGRFDGTVELASGAEAPVSLTAALRSPDARVRAEDVVVDGPVGVSATLDWSGALPVGPFEIDASGADVSYAAGPVLAAHGRGATVRGVLVERDGALAVEDVRARVTALRAQVERR